jgi:hypothetical protein
MSYNNSNVNISYIVSSIIKTIIFIVIVGVILYLFKTYQPDSYNKYIYSLVTGKKINVVASNMSTQTTQNIIEADSESENNFDIVEPIEKADDDKKVSVASVSTSSKRKVVNIVEKNTSPIKIEASEEIQPPVSNTSPKFIDGYEVITIEDTEPAELSRNSSSSRKNNNAGVKKIEAQQASPQQEIVYVEPAIPEDYDGPNWAVVAINTEIYNKENKKLGSILGGIVVETNGHIFKKNATLIQCFQIKDGVVNKDVEFYIQESDLVMFRGPYTTQIHPDKTTIIDFCTLRGKYQSLLDDLRKEEIKKNPHYSEYQEAVAAYKNLKNESDELEEKRKTTSGAAKASLEDQIHKLKLKEVTARKTLNDAQRKYDSWRNANLGSGEDIKITPTPELNKLKREMDALHPRANEICPGI